MLIFLSSPYNVANFTHHIHDIITDLSTQFDRGVRNGQLCRVEIIDLNMLEVDRVEMCNN